MTDQDQLRKAIASIRAGNKAEGAESLKQILKVDRDNDLAWLWMTSCVETTDDKIYCLREVLRINPGSEQARALLARLQPADLAPSLEEIVAPAAVTPAPLPTYNPPAPAAPARESGSVITILVVLLVLLGILWLGIGALQIGMGMTIAENEGAILTGLLNIVISIVNLALIGDVNKRKKKVVTSLTLLGVVGGIWGMAQLSSGAWVQACAIPLYIALGVIAYANKEQFPVEEPGEKGGGWKLGKFEIGLIVAAAVILVGVVVIFATM